MPFCNWNKLVKLEGNMYISQALIKEKVLTKLRRFYFWFGATPGSALKLLEGLKGPHGVPEKNLGGPHSGQVPYTLY